MHEIISLHLYRLLVIIPSPLLLIPNSDIPLHSTHATPYSFHSRQKNILENRFLVHILFVFTTRMSAAGEKTESKPIDSDYYKWSKQISASKKVRILPAR